MKAYNIPIKATNKTDAAFNAINKNVGSVTKNLLSAKGAFAGFIGVAGATALVGMAKDSIEFADAIGKTADKLGVSTDALQEYRFAAERSGVQQTALDVGIQRFTRRLGEAAEGTGVLNKVLKEQNIQIRDSNGNIRSTEAVLNDYADSIQNAGSGQEKLLLAFKAFDTEGAAMVNMLRDGSTGLEKLRDTARDSGAIMNEELIRKAEVINDRWETLTNTIGVNLKSAMISVVDVFVDSRTEIEVVLEKLKTTQEEMQKAASRGASGEGLVSFTDKLKKLGEEYGRLTQKINASNDAQTPKDISLTDEQIQQIILRDKMVAQLQLENQKEKLFQEEQAELDSQERKRENQLAHLRQGEEDARRDAERRLQIERNFERQKIESVASTFGTLSTLMSSRSRKLFEIGKTSAIATSLINTYQAVTKTMAETPYPYNIPLAVAQGVAGMVQVQNIRSQQFGGGGSVSVGGSNASAGAGLPTNSAFNPPFNGFESSSSEPAGQTIINLYNAEGFSNESVSNLAEQLGDYLEKTDTVLIRNGSRGALELQQQ